MSAPLLDSDAAASAQGYGAGSGSDGESTQPAGSAGYDPYLQPNDNSLNTDPSHKSTKFLYFLAFFSAIGGFLFGYDTGVISGAMLLITDQYHLSTVYQELVVSITVAAAALFAFIGGYLNIIFGRKPIIIIASIIFTVGAVLMGITVNKEMLLAGRLLVGAGIGNLHHTGGAFGISHRVNLS